MYLISTNVHVNLIYSIQTGISNSCDLEGGGFSFISFACSNAIYIKVHTL